MDDFDKIKTLSEKINYSKEKKEIKDLFALTMTVSLDDEPKVPWEEKLSLLN